jgi:hypothetical protein
VQESSILGTPVLRGEGVSLWHLSQKKSSQGGWALAKPRCWQNLRIGRNLTEVRAEVGAGVRGKESLLHRRIFTYNRDSIRKSFSLWSLIRTKRLWETSSSRSSLRNYTISIRVDKLKGRYQQESALWGLVLKLKIVVCSSNSSLVGSLPRESAQDPIQG